MDTTPRTMVISEDLHVLDATTRELAPHAAVLLAHLPGSAGVAEVESSVVRSSTPAVASASDLRAEMRGLRTALREAGEAAGLAVVAAAALPLSPPSSSIEEETLRFRRLLADYEYLVRDQVYCSTGVRVEVADRDRAVQVSCRISPYLPALLALTASSPFLRDGSDLPAGGHVAGGALRSRGRPGGSGDFPPASRDRRPHRPRDLPPRGADRPRRPGVGHRAAG